MTYAEKLKDPRWQKKRLKILERDEWCCQMCFDEETELHVHHKRYIKWYAPWEYEDRLLLSLCKSCHEQIEELKGRICEEASGGPSFDVLVCCLALLRGPTYGDFCLAVAFLTKHPDEIAVLSGRLKEEVLSKRKAVENVR